MGRTWGYWTRGKLDVLRRYLEAFAKASTRAPERIYLDTFAGVPENEDRLSGEAIEGSARLALGVGDPPFTKVRLFELEANAEELEQTLRDDFPGRDIAVYGGDCNEQVAVALADLAEFNWAPTFAFVDPNGHEAEWRTLELLAGFKRKGKPKVELFLLFASPMFTRLLKTDGSVREEDKQAITAVYGTDDWLHIYHARLDGEITPSEAQLHYLNLMRWRIEGELGYEWTHPLEVRNEQGRVIYYMIFATDHEAGDRIMRHIYAMAAAEFPAMREEARRMRKRKEDDEAGIVPLFDDLEDFAGPIQRGERFYEHEPPFMPWFLKSEEDSEG